MIFLFSIDMKPLNLAVFHMQKIASSQSSHTCNTKVRIRFKRLTHRYFESFTHVQNKRKCLSVISPQLFGNCLWQLNKN